jgi:hypothetical protein
MSLDLWYNDNWGDKADLNYWPSTIDENPNYYGDFGGTDWWPAADRGVDSFDDPTGYYYGGEWPTEDSFINYDPSDTSWEDPYGYYYEGEWDTRSLAEKGSDWFYGLLGEDGLDIDAKTIKQIKGFFQGAKKGMDKRGGGGGGRGRLNRASLPRATLGGPTQLSGAGRTKATNDIIASISQRQRAAGVAMSNMTTNPFSTANTLAELQEHVTGSGSKAKGPYQKLPGSSLRQLSLQAPRIT